MKELKVGDWVRYPIVSFDEDMGIAQINEEREGVFSIKTKNCIISWYRENELIKMSDVEVMLYILEDS